MIIVLLLLLIILWIGTSNNNSIVLYNEKLNDLRSQVDQICQLGNISISYTLAISSTLSYTEDKNIIHLVLWDPSQQCFYSNNTLLRVLLHEISHLLCPINSSNHPPFFYEIEHYLLNLAYQLHLLDPNELIEKNYPCNN